MPSPAGTERYSLPTRVLHWLVALVILGLIGLGWWMVDLTYYDPWYNRSLELHKGIGMIGLPLALAFVLWALVKRGPPLPEMPRWQRAAAHATHGLLFLLMLALPVTGYLISTSAGDGVGVFGLFEVPALVDGGERLRDLAVDLHYYMAYGALGLVCLHAGAALKHQLLDRDGLLRRMLW